MNYDLQEVDVRAPIPQRQEVLVDGPDELAFTFRGRKRTARSVFDKFRDFEAEASKNFVQNLFPFFFYHFRNISIDLFKIILFNFYLS